MEIPATSSIDSDYAKATSNSMDQYHYAHFEVNKGAWYRSLYDFIKQRYTDAFTKAMAQSESIVIHYIAPGLNGPCLDPELWRAIQSKLEVVHVYDIDTRVLDATANWFEIEMGFSVEKHTFDVTNGHGQQLVSLCSSIPLQRVLDSDFNSSTRAKPTFQQNHATHLVLSEMVAAATGLAVFAELRKSGSQQSEIDELEQKFNSSVARQHIDWIASNFREARRGIAVLVSDVNRIWSDGSKTDSFMPSLQQLIERSSLVASETKSTIWVDVDSPLKGWAPHNHRVEAHILELCSELP